MKTIRIGAVFKHDDPNAILVLQLIAVANDFEMLARFADATSVHEKGDIYAKEIFRASRIYVCRMWMLHLPDVWSLVNRQDFQRLIDHLKQHDPELPEYAASLRRALNRTPLQTLVAHFRNKFAGHPDPDEFRRALSLAQDDLMTIWTVIPALGSHFNVTDRLFERIMFEKSGAEYSRGAPHAAQEQEFAVKTLLEELVQAQVALSNLVYHLVVAMYLDAPGL